MKRVYAMGELLIDFVCSDVDTHLSEGLHYIRKPGGAPANVCGVIAKLGGNASFIGKVGDDPFGRYLISVLENYGVDTRFSLYDRGVSTTLAFVSIMAGGERDFYFNRGADENLGIDEIDTGIFTEHDIIHFGSATGFLGGELTKAYNFAFKRARDAGMFVSFDPNYRQDLWKGDEAAFVSLIRDALGYADFIKFSEEELYLVSGKDTLDEALATIHARGVPYIAVTLGKAGSVISSVRYRMEVPSKAVTSIDSTGAGDAFVGALLLQLSKCSNCSSVLEDEHQVKQMVSYANTVAALVCTQYGAISAIPSIKDIDDFMKK